MENVIITNLTPHDVVLVKEDGNKVVFPRAEEPARVESTEDIVDYINGIPVAETNFGEVINLPEAANGVYYIVSRLVLSACTDRTDLLVPAGQIRNESGQVCGCAYFSRK